jgi:RPA family protein
MPEERAVNPHTRVFAGELARTTLHRSTGNGLTEVLITPGGAYCSCIFLAGALTRVDQLPGEFMEAWVSDPTGTFLLAPSRQDEEIRASLAAMEPPVFITATGELQVRRNHKKTVQVRPIDIRVVDKTVRDSWVIRTAEITIARLELLENALSEGTEDQDLTLAIRHYHTDREQVREFCRMVEEALTKVGRVDGGAIKTPDPREIILELIKTNSGPRGITITDLVPLAARMGVRDGQVIAIVKQLVEEDECYQPAAGLVKLL